MLPTVNTTNTIKEQRSQPNETHQTPSVACYTRNGVLANAVCSQILSLPNPLMVNKGRENPIRIWLEPTYRWEHARSLKNLTGSLDEAVHNFLYFSNNSTKEEIKMSSIFIWGTHMLLIYYSVIRTSVPTKSWWLLRKVNIPTRRLPILC